MSRHKQHPRPPNASFVSAPGGGFDAPADDADDGTDVEPIGGILKRMALAFAFLVLAIWAPGFLPFLIIFAISALRRMQSSSTTSVRQTALTGQYREWVREGRAIHTEIQAVVARLPATLRRTFWPLCQQAQALVKDLETLARSAQQMDAYLSGPYGREACQVAERLRAQIATTTDPVVREQLEQALKAIEDALADQQEIVQLRERAQAQAVHINASLQSVLSEVIKQRYADLDIARQEYHTAAERLQAVKSQVDAVQQVITNRPFPEA
jgi:hypothetical protein